MKVRIHQLKDKLKEESATLHILEMTPRIRQAVDLLEEKKYHITVKDSISEESFQLDLSSVIYIEYLERNLFFYTRDRTYYVRQSLAKFMHHMPPYFIQISKNTLLNITQVNSFSVSTSGSLFVHMTIPDKLVVSRRFVKGFKKSLEEIAVFYQK